MKPIFQHIFPGIIQRIAYFGEQTYPKLWIDVISNTTKKWFIVDLNNWNVKNIHQPFADTQVYTWIDAIGNESYFSILEQGKNPSAANVYKINLLNGSIIEKQDHYKPLSSNSKMASHIFTVENPTHYRQDDAYFKDFKAFFSKKFDLLIDKGIDYLESKDKLIFSYYLYENTWVNRLKVCNLSFNTLWEDQIESNELIGHHTFQVFENLIIYTKNKNELIILGNE